MTPELPIPEEARDAVARVLWDEVYGEDERTFDQLDSTEQEELSWTANAALAAALPHLRSLQVETQVRAGRLLGLEEAAKAVEGYFEDPHCEGEPCEDCSLVRELAAIIRSLGAQAAEATSEPRTDLPVGPSHPKDSKTSREAL